MNELTSVVLASSSFCTCFFDLNKVILVLLKICVCFTYSIFERVIIVNIGIRALGSDNRNKLDTILLVAEKTLRNLKIELVCLRISLVWQCTQRYAVHNFLKIDLSPTIVQED